MSTGAINEVDERYRATISGCEIGGGDIDWAGYKVEIWVHGMMEVIWHEFCFSVNMAVSGPFEVRTTDAGRNEQVTSKVFCEILGLDPKYIFNGTLHPHSHSIDKSKIVGEEIGVAVDWYHGRRSIKGFYPVSELATMAVVD